MIFQTWDMEGLIDDPNLNLANESERYDTDKLQIGYDGDNGAWYNYWETPVMWDFHKFPHLMIVGASGTGKTVAVKSILARAEGWIPRLKAYICDFKNEDFRFCGGLPRFNSYGKCAFGLDTFYNAFKARQNGEDESREPLWLIFDEWAAYLTACDKKQAEADKAKLSELLMLGRAFGITVVTIQQMAYKEDFGKARNNFGACLGMGELDKELKEMVFPGHKDQMCPVDEVGLGYFRQGNRLNRVWIPNLHSDEGEQEIKRLVTR